MTTLEYLIAKNEIVKRVTKHTLIPEDQLVEVPYHEDFEPSRLLVILNCPYCLVFPDCEECPMELARNRCTISVGNTYQKNEEPWNVNATDSDKQELYDLGVEYKESNEKAKDEKKETK